MPPPPSQQPQPPDPPPSEPSSGRHERRVTLAAGVIGTEAVPLGRSEAATVTHVPAGGEGGVGSITLLGPGDETRPGELDIRREPHGAYGGIYGNAYEMRGEDERDRVVAAYAELLRGAHSVARVAHMHRVRMSTRRSAHMSLERRLVALAKLAIRVRRGEHIYLRCVCKPRACHGDVIVAWVRERSTPP